MPGYADEDERIERDPAFERLEVTAEHLQSRIKERQTARKDKRTKRGKDNYTSRRERKYNK